MKTIRYSPLHSDYEGVVVADRITNLWKKKDDVVEIHLDNGDVLLSTDSMNTLEAKMKLLEDE